MKKYFLFFVICFPIFALAQKQAKSQRALSNIAVAIAQQESLDSFIVSRIIDSLVAAHGGLHVRYSARQSFSEWCRNIRRSNTGFLARKMFIKPDTCCVLDHFLSELAHGEQVRQHGKWKMSLWCVKDFLRAVMRGRSYRSIYSCEDSFEFDAHTCIEPELRQKFWKLAKVETQDLCVP